LTIEDNKGNKQKTAKIGEEIVPPVHDINEQQSQHLGENKCGQNAKT
jgi:hypothetical protein